MKVISNSDFALVKRLLPHLQQLQGEDAKTKNVKRRALLLQKKLNKK